MAIINLYTKVDEEYKCEVINHNGNAVNWLLNNIEKGQNFSVYEGELSKDHEISRDFKRIYSADEISVFILPASGIEIAYVVAAVLVVVALSTVPKALTNLNRGQESPNNSLTDRNNKPRPNQRIVDICGENKSIPDVLAREFIRYIDDIEVRVGYYCVARNNLLIESVKEGDTLISDIQDASAGVYSAYNSPNNALPDIQIGDPIDELVYGVTQSPDAIGQTLEAPNQGTLKLDGNFNVEETGVINDVDNQFDFTDNFSVNDVVNLINIYVFTGVGTLLVGEDTHIVTAVEPHKITFNITNDPSWGLIGPTPLAILQSGSSQPLIELIQDASIGPFKMTSFKVNRLIVNIGALNGIYKEDSNGRKKQEVEYIVKYQKLDDNGQPIGVETPVNEIITGNSSKEKGQTTDIDLGGETFVQWSAERVTLIDFGYDGNIVDQIKVRSVFGLSNVDDEHFGNVTTVQTKRTNRFLSTATKTPELNCIATELVQKYQNGSFDVPFTPNTQAMQSLIRMALDPFIGRRQESELDLDLLVSIQDECEVYFESSEAGEFNYSFDSTSINAQETFVSIAKAAFITLWREGRVLKGWFESPQSIPSMVFTHRSKQPNAETWSRKRQSADTKDSIEFTYSDANQYTKETLFFPEDQSGTNPARVELTGIKGKQQAFWHMMREFNKKKYQEITVDFSATAEGRFVKPNRLISVVKGSRVFTYDGYISAVDGLLITLSQDVVFTPSDTHSVILKNRDGSTESITVTETANSNIIKLSLPPSQTIYTGNDELKTEFSFGNEARLDAQLMMPETIAPSGKSYVKIKAVNYSPLYYTSDSTQPGKAFSSGFNEGFS